jgi:hypothetical protein
VQLDLLCAARVRSINVDLSEQLRARKGASAPAPAPQRAAAAEAGPSAAGAAVAAQQRALFRRGRASSASFAANPPSKGEARRWERNNRFAKRVRERVADAVHTLGCGSRCIPPARPPRCAERVCSVIAQTQPALVRAPPVPRQPVRLQGFQAILASPSFEPAPTAPALQGMKPCVRLSAGLRHAVACWRIRRPKRCRG